MLLQNIKHGGFSAFEPREIANLRCILISLPQQATPHSSSASLRADCRIAPYSHVHTKQLPAPSWRFLSTRGASHFPFPNCRFRYAGGEHGIGMRSPRSSLEGRCSPVSLGARGEEKERCGEGEEKRM